MHVARGDSPTAGGILSRVKKNVWMQDMGYPGKMPATQGGYGLPREDMGYPGRIFNKMASGQGSHSLIESPTFFMEATQPAFH